MTEGENRYMRLYGLNKENVVIVKTDLESLLYKRSKDKIKLLSLEVQ